MILNKIKSGNAYERISYLESQIATELEPLVFSVVYPLSQMSYRFGGLSSDPETEVYKHLGAIAITASVGVVGTVFYYLTHRKVRHPVEVADNAVGATISAAERAGKRVNDLTGRIR